jgi:hypothetical protein
VSSVQYLVHSVWCTVSSVQCLVHSVWCTVSGAQCLVHSVWCTVSGVQCLVSSVWCTVSGAQCLVHTNDERGSVSPARHRGPRSSRAGRGRARPGEAGGIRGLEREPGCPQLPAWPLASGQGRGRHIDRLYRPLHCTALHCTALHCRLCYTRHLRVWLSRRQRAATQSDEAGPQTAASPGFYDRRAG